jgi:hypothetical protein
MKQGERDLLDSIQFARKQASRTVNSGLLCAKRGGLHTVRD